MPDANVGLRVPPEIANEVSRVSETADVPTEAPVPKSEFSLVFVTIALNDFPTSDTLTT